MDCTHGREKGRGSDEASTLRSWGDGAAETSRTTRAQNAQEMEAAATREEVAHFQSAKRGRRESEVRKRGGARGGRGRRSKGDDDEGTGGLGDVLHEG
jgi:hypothetical protein